MFQRFFATLAATGVALTAPAAVAQEYPDCPDKVTMAYTANYKPFQWVTKDGNLRGFDIEIGRALCEELEIKCNWRQIPWTAIIPAMQAKKADIAIASMASTDKRDKKVDFTNKYYTPTGHFTGPKDMNVEISKEGLKGMTIGAERGTTQVRLVKNRFGDAVEVKTYETQRQATLDLINGRIDLIIADTIMTYHSFLKREKGKNFEFKGPAFDDPQYYAGTALTLPEKGSEKLKTCFNKAIAAIREDGTYDRISEKYFGRNIYNGWEGK